jgi:hypothetical protein
MSFLEALDSWRRTYDEVGGRRGVTVEFHDGPVERPKRAVWIIVTGAQAAGQMTLWESGECETEAAGVDGTTLLLRSRILPAASFVAGVADDLVDHVADYSGS